MRLITREARLGRKVGLVVLAVAAAWAAWPVSVVPLTHPPRHSPALVRLR